MTLIFPKIVWTCPLTVSEVLDLLENDEFGLSDSDESEFEGDNIEGYLPRAELEVGLGESTAPMEEDDDEQMDLEYIVSNDRSVSSEESDTQPLGKSDSKYNSVKSTSLFQLNQIVMRENLVSTL